MTKMQKKNRRLTRIAVIGILAFFLILAVLNAAVKTRVEATVTEEIREITTEENVTEGNRGRSPIAARILGQ